MSCEKNRASSMSKLLALLAASSALPLAMLLPKEAAAYNCYGNYCPNAGSPVVGGFAETTGQWSIYQTFTYEPMYFGNVSASNFTYTVVNGAWTNVPTSVSCPSNTAEIAVQGGYQADNGQWYSYQGNPVTLCVATDTYALP